MPVSSLDGRGSLYGLKSTSSPDPPLPVQELSPHYGLGERTPKVHVPLKAWSLWRCNWEEVKYTLRTWVVLRVTETMSLKGLCICFTLWTMR